MRGRPGREAPVLLVKDLASINPDLIEFKEPVDGFRITLSGEVQKSSPLVEFFFLGVGSSSPLHSKTFLHR